MLNQWNETTLRLWSGAMKPSASCVCFHIGLLLFLYFLGLFSMIFNISKHKIKTGLACGQLSRLLCYFQHISVFGCAVGCFCSSLCQIGEGFCLMLHCVELSRPPYCMCGSKLKSRTKSNPESAIHATSLSASGSKMNKLISISRGSLVVVFKNLKYLTFHNFLKTLLKSREVVLII